MLIWEVRQRLAWLIKLAGTTMPVDVIWRPLVLNSGLADKIASYFVKRVPLGRWRLLQMDGIGLMEAKVFNAAEDTFSSLQSLSFTENFYSEQFVSMLAQKNSRPLVSLSIQLSNHTSLQALSRVVSPSTLVTIESSPLTLENYTVFFDSIGRLSIHNTPKFRDAVLMLEYLRELTIQAFDGDAFSSLELPNLEVLHISGFTAPSSRVELLSLRYLKIKGGEVMDCSCFNVPVLETLHLEWKGDYLDEAFNHAIPSGFSQISPSKLIVNIPAIAPSTLSALVSTLSPHLSYLTVVMDLEVDVALFSRLLAMWEDVGLDAHDPAANGGDDDDQNNHSRVHTLSHLHISVGRRCLLKDIIDLEEPARLHFQANNGSGKSIAIDWTDGNSFVLS